MRDARAFEPDRSALRHIVHKTRGHRGSGPIARLMSPSDLGEVLKPFVFLDLFDMEAAGLRTMMAGMPLHPHSGIATVTVLTEGRMRYDDPENGSGTIGYGGVEWMRAGAGVWHGGEMLVDDVPRLQGFQLWLALPPAVENGTPVSRYVESKDMPRVGPAHVVIGRHENAQSPVPAPDGLNYLLVTLRPGERWTYQPPAGHTVAWLALAKGALSTDSDRVDAGEMAIFEPGNTRIRLEATGSADAVFVLGSAVPHPFPLHLGHYSVHTNATALAAGERRIAELKRQLDAAGDRRTASGTIPVFR
ncbi:pirin family protein [Lysobacter sp. K5869]|nr:pirin family protein [Lysobacter sp. K5869]